MTTRDDTEAPATTSDGEAQGTPPDPAADTGETRGSETKDPKWYRQELKRKDQEISDLNSRLRRAAFVEAGIPVDEGLGKAIADLYDGEATAEAVLAFAKGYGWEGAPSDPGQLRKVDDAQKDADAIVANSNPVEPATIDDEIAKAEAEGRYQDAFNLKMAKMQQNA